MTYSAECRFRTITRSRYLSLPPNQRADALRELYWSNIQRLHAALAFCGRRGIRLYRATSALFPMSDGPLGTRLLTEEFPSLLAAVGRHADRLGIRVVLHPDQFVVLNSESRKTVATSRKILDKHALSFDLMGLEQSPWNLMNIHGGKGGRGDELVEEIGTLPPNVKSRLTIENDEYSYGAAAVLDLCKRAGVPMVFDCHHHVIAEKLESYADPSVEHFTRAAAETWPDPAWQLVHVSNGTKAFLDRGHSHLITAMPPAFRDVPWIEVEAKGKELAIDALVAAWPEAAVPTDYVGGGADGEAEED